MGSLKTLDSSSLLYKQAELSVVIWKYLCWFYITQEALEKDFHSNIWNSPTIEKKQRRAVELVDLEQHSRTGQEMFEMSDEGLGFKADTNVYLLLADMEWPIHTCPHLIHITGNG